MERLERCRPAADPDADGGGHGDPPTTMGPGASGGRVCRVLSQSPMYPPQGQSGRATQVTAPPPDCRRHCWSQSGLSRDGLESSKYCQGRCWLVCADTPCRDCCSCWSLVDAASQKLRLRGRGSTSFGRVQPTTRGSGNGAAPTGDRRLLIDQASMPTRCRPGEWSAHAERPAHTPNADRLRRRRGHRTCRRSVRFAEGGPCRQSGRHLCSRSDAGRHLHCRLVCAMPGVPTARCQQAVPDGRRRRLGPRRSAGSRRAACGSNPTLRSEPIVCPADQRRSRDLAIRAILSVCPMWTEELEIA